MDIVVVVDFISAVVYVWLYITSHLEPVSLFAVGKQRHQHIVPSTASRHTWVHCQPLALRLQRIYRRHLANTVEHP